MKTTRNIFAVFAVGILLMTVYSCSKDFYTNANVNPNAPGSVPSGSLLSGIQVSLAYTQGGAASQFTSLFTQQTVGAQRQAQAYYEYIITPADPEYLWDQMYTDVMENNYTLMNQAGASGQNEYYGITNVLMAYSLQVTADFWGSEPYSGALKGTANLQPAYDNGQTLYSTAMQLLNTGITALSNPGKGSVYPTSDDLMFGGNESEWIAFAEAVKARLFIHQCKHGNSAYEDSAIAEATAAINGGFVNAEVYFGSAATSNGPWSQFNNQRGGYISFVDTAGGPIPTPTLIDTMEALNDPRDSIYVNFSPSSLSLGNYYGSPSSPVEFITKEELYFIIAEANERLGNAAAAQTAYTSAITANMNKLGVSANEATLYLAAHGTLPISPASALHTIGVQEWIALYLNPEAWVEWRRNDAPALQPIAGPEVVRRMIYPNSEVTLNPNCPSATMFVPQLFWDN